MNHWFAKMVVLVATVALVTIPASLHHRGPRMKPQRSRKGPLENVLLTLATVGFILPLVWVVTPVLALADYPLRRAPFFAGSFCLGLGLWLTFRCHAELGPNWSITLEVREDQALVNGGVYRHVRHPMYLALLIYASGLALVLPNWLAGPSYLVAVALLVALRIGPEERMMQEAFGKEYDAYMARTKRLIPSVW